MQDANPAALPVERSNIVRTIDELDTVSQPEPLSTGLTVPPRNEGTLERLTWSVSSIVTLLREMGPSWAFYRLVHAIDRKTGLTRLRNRPRSWSEESQRVFSPSCSQSSDSWAKSHAFFFPGATDEVRSAVREFPGAVEKADALLSGEWLFFGCSQMQLDFPPLWNRNPVSQRSAPTDLHWSRISETEYGDIKLIWEASRFTPVFSLARAYAATGDERYAEAFWNLVEEWAKHNPPHRGPNWSCGQEASFRLMAWYFGLHAFAASKLTTKARLQLLTLMIFVHADRIERNIGYALSQNNNHGLSEAVGLYTVGLLSPELSRSQRWRQRGRRLIEQLVARQIYADGSYVQHSTNYHRVMLHDLLWAMRLGELNDQRLSDRAYRNVTNAVDFLASMVDAATGFAPNYGSNDGANVLPLNSCDYSDMRPVLQAANYLVRRQHLYPPGPWDEDLLWLFGPESLRHTPAVDHTSARCRQIHAAKSGYHLLHGHESTAFIRCGAYQDRPGQADQLHLDLRWRGINVLCDPGTYLYNGAEPWRNGLAGTAVHNTVMVDGRDQMTRAGKFLWVHWAQGHVEYSEASSNGIFDYWQGSHDGYARSGVLHRRAVMRIRDTWLVVDDVCGTGSHSASLQWLFLDSPYRFDPARGAIICETSVGAFDAHVWVSRPFGLSLVRAGEELLDGGLTIASDVLRGWFSRSYAIKEPSLSLVARATGVLPIRFITVFGLGPAELNCDERHISTGPTSDTQIRLSEPGARRILESCSYQ